MIEQCQYQAWLTYIKHEKGLDSIYGCLGGNLHDSLEQIINQQADVSCLLPNIRSALDECETVGLSFPKDFRGNDSIREKWIKDIEHFCKTFYPPKGNFKTEQLLIYNVSPTRAVQGYIDLMKFEPDGSVSVYDWKSSSAYKPQDLLEHGRQLVIYAMALEQAGYKIKNLAWIMLKYVSIKYNWYATSRSKNKTRITKVCNRSEIYKTIAPAVEAACRDAGMDESDIDLAMMDFKETNILGDLFPASVKAQFEIKPYVRPYPYTPELKAEALDYINRVADIYESLPKDESVPWPAVSITHKESFFCNNLCNYRKTCPAIKAYNEQVLIKDPPASEENLF